MPSEDTIEAISRKSSTQRQHLIDRIQQYWDDLDKMVKDPGSDPFESPAAHFLMKQCPHIVAQEAREAARDRSKMIREHGFKKLKDAHTAPPELKALFGISICAGILGAGLGCTPYALGVTGAAAASYQAMSTGVQSVFGQGSQNVAGIVQSGAQFEVAEATDEIERDKQIQSDNVNEQQAQQRLVQSRAEDERRVEQARHEATKAVLGG